MKTRTTKATSITLKLLFSLVITFQFLSSNEIKKINLQLHWKHQFQYAGFYAAIEKGYYKDVGLELEVKEWNPSINRIEDLISKKSTFSITAADKLDEIINSKEIVIISSYLHKTPVALVAKPDIYFPKDLLNKKIMGFEADIKSSVFYKMWKSSNINTDDLDIVPHNFKLDSFIKGEVDALQVYVTDQLYELAKKDVKYNIIDTNSYGVDFYDLMTITSKKFANNNPILISKFKEATKKGWEYALNNKEEIVELILKKYNTQNKTKNALIYEANRLEDFILRDIYEIGLIEEEKLKKIALIHLNMQNIKEIGNIEDLIFSLDKKKNSITYTKEEKEYLKRKQNINICRIPNKNKRNKKDIYKSVGINLIEKVNQEMKLDIKYIKTNSYKQSLEFTRDGKCDLLTLTRKTEKRNKELNILEPFIVQPLVLATHNDTTYIDNVKNLKDKTFAILHGHTKKEEIKKLYPNFKLIEVNSPLEGLIKVKKGHIFAYIDIPVTIAHSIKQNFLEDLKIARDLEINAGLGFSVNKNEPMLAQIITKTLTILPKDYISNLLNNWYAIKFEKGFHYELIWKILISAFIILLFLLYWTRKIQKANKLLKKTQEELHEKNRELRELSTTDRLTKLYNRHKIDEVLLHEKEMFNRYKFNFGIILLDIDFFKSVNDNHGHQVGDLILIEFANLLKNKIRKADFIGRWGGEEFLIICINSDKEAIINTAEKCRKTIEEYNFSRVKHKTASFGISFNEENKTIEELIREADLNLYKAKETGRNKIVY